jgi:hypothetical protein
MRHRGIPDRLIALALVTAVAVAVEAQAPASPASLDAHVARVMKTFEVPGLALAGGGEKAIACGGFPDLSGIAG